MKKRIPLFFLVFSLIFFSVYINACITTTFYITTTKEKQQPTSNTLWNNSKKKESTCAKKKIILALGKEFIEKSLNTHIFFPNFFLSLSIFSILCTAAI